MLQDQSSIFDETFTENAKTHLLETARWTKFLAIFGFIFIGIMGAAMFYIMLQPSNPYSVNGMAGFTSIGVVVMVLLLMLAAYLYPTIQLFNFSKLIKSGLNNKNPEQIEFAFKCQKNMFRFIGILTILILMIYVFYIGYAVIDAFA